MAGYKLQDSKMAPTVFVAISIVLFLSFSAFSDSDVFGHITHSQILSPLNYFVAEAQSTQAGKAGDNSPWGLVVNAHPIKSTIFSEKGEYPVIAGNVSDHAGSPALGANVRVSLGSTVIETKTDSAGHFIANFSGASLPPRTYIVNIHAKLDANYLEIKQNKTSGSLSSSNDPRNSTNSTENQQSSSNSDNSKATYVRQGFSSTSIRVVAPESTNATKTSSDALHSSRAINENDTVSDIPSAAYKQSLYDFYGINPDTSTTAQNDYNSLMDKLIRFHSDKIQKSMEKRDENYKKIQKQQEKVQQAREKAKQAMEQEMEKRKYRNGTLSDFYLDTFLSGRKHDLKQLYSDQLNYTNSKMDKAKQAKNKVLEDGGTVKQAREAYFETLGSSREEMERLLQGENSLQEKSENKTTQPSSGNHTVQNSTQATPTDVLSPTVNGSNTKGNVTSSHAPVGQTVSGNNTADSSASTGSQDAKQIQQKGFGQLGISDNAPSDFGGGSMTSTSVFLGNTKVNLSTNGEFVIIKVDDKRYWIRLQN